MFQHFPYLRTLYIMCFEVSWFNMVDRWTFGRLVEFSTSIGVQCAAGFLNRHPLLQVVLMCDTEIPAETHVESTAPPIVVLPNLQNLFIPIHWIKVSFL